jgi:hypothetical protein
LSAWINFQHFLHRRLRSDGFCGGRHILISHWGSGAKSGDIVSLADSHSLPQIVNL